MNLKIYLIAGERNIGPNIVREHGGLYANVGQTHRPIEKRLKDFDYARKNAAGQFITFGSSVWHVPEDIERRFLEVDDEVRRVLINSNPGVVESSNNRQNTEEVIFKTDPGDGSIAVLLVEEAIKEVIGKVHHALIPFLPRGYQFGDLETVNVKLKELTRVLLSAFPGWGKSTCAPEIMHRISEPNRGNFFLFTTPITDSLDGIREAINTVEYGDSIFYAITLDQVDHNTQSLITQKLIEGTNVVLLLSVQGLRRSDNGSRLTKDEAEQINTILRKKFSFLYDIKIRLWIRDEFHKEYGGYITKKVFEGIEPEYLLDMTATPYNLIEIGEYIKDQIVGDTILNVLKQKKAGVEWYQKFPSIRIETWEGAPLNGTELSELYDAVEEWDPRKLHVVENDQLKHADIIRALNRRMYGWHRLSSGRYIEGVSKEKNLFDILNDPQLSKVAKKVGLHVMAEGNSEYEANVRCNLYAELLNEDPEQKMWYVAADQIKKEAHRRSVKVVNVVKEHQHIAKNNGRLGLIIVTHRMLLTGSDIDFLGHIVLLDRMGSLNDFVQLIGRIFRVYPGKDFVKLYVACPGMEVSVKVYEAAKAEATQYGEGDPQEYYDCIPITEYHEYNGKLVSKSVGYQEMIERFNEHQNRLLSGDWYSKNYFSKYEGLDELVDGLDFNELAGGLVGPTMEVTDGSTAKVKKPSKKPTTKDELEKDNEERKLGKNWKATVATMLNESIRLGYSNESETLKDVFDTAAAQYEFGEANVQLIKAVFGHTEFYNAVDYKYRQRIAEVRELGYGSIY